MRQSKSLKRRQTDDAGTQRGTKICRGQLRGGNNDEISFLDLFERVHKHVAELASVIGHAGRLSTETTASCSFLLLHLRDMPIAVINESAAFIDECAALFDTFLKSLQFRTVHCSTQMKLEFNGEQRVNLYSGEFVRCDAGWRTGMPNSITVKNDYVSEDIDMNSVSVGFTPYTGEGKPYAGLLLRNESFKKMHAVLFVNYEELMTECVKVDTGRMLRKLYELYRPHVTDRNVIERCPVSDDTPDAELREYIATMCLSMKQGTADEGRLTYPAQPVYIFERDAPSPHAPKRSYATATPDPATAAAAMAEPMWPKESSPKIGEARRSRRVPDPF